MGPSAVGRADPRCNWPRALLLMCRPLAGLRGGWPDTGSSAPSAAPDPREFCRPRERARPVRTREEAGTDAHHRGGRAQAGARGGGARRRGAGAGPAADGHAVLRPPGGGAGRGPPRDRQPDEAGRGRGAPAGRGAGAAGGHRQGARGHRRAPTDLQQVLDRICESAGRLCGGWMAIVSPRRGRLDLPRRLVASPSARRRPVGDGPPVGEVVPLERTGIAGGGRISSSWSGSPAARAEPRSRPRGGPSRPA